MIITWFSQSNFYSWLFSLFGLLCLQLYLQLIIPLRGNLIIRERRVIWQPQRVTTKVSQNNLLRWYASLFTIFCPNIMVYLRVLFALLFTTLQIFVFVCLQMVMKFIFRHLFYADSLYVLWINNHFLLIAMWLRIIEIDWRKYEWR